MNYLPQPIWTEHVSLPEGLQQLTERLAENAHDHWAAERMRDGWTYGPERNDSAQKHPCLIPYSQLPETEKKYDRKTAIETLKAIIALGYRIKKEE